MEGREAATRSNIDPEYESNRTGPYVVTNGGHFTDWLGQELPIQSETALCRCGQSRNKPFCDGSHATSNFSGEKDQNLIADKRDVYEGQQIEIFDNLGICAHSGFCTDRLSSVFHVGAERFITPSGGRMGEIIQAVRACPSGALSFAIDHAEARIQVDQDREPWIEVSKDGPYRVTGGIRLVDESGNDVRRAQGSLQEHFSLCRCGHSQNKPFCSGMHWCVKFADPAPSPQHQSPLFEWAGGLPALLRMTRIFYTKYVPQNPIVGPLFASMSPDHPERVAAWLSEVFGGPKFYSERYGGYSRMISQHVGKNISEEQRKRWVQMLCQSADDAKVPEDPEFRAALSLTLNGVHASVGKFSAECIPSAKYAGSTLVVGVRGEAGCESPSAGPEGRTSDFDHDSRVGRSRKLRSAHQTAFQKDGSGVDEFCLRSLVIQRCPRPRSANSQAIGKRNYAV